MTQLSELRVDQQIYLCKHCCIGILQIAKMCLAGEMYQADTGIMGSDAVLEVDLVAG